ncbi:hypothetical protein L7D48_11315 [Streptomyces sp. S1A]|uniref:hypothetical protein n=1 Tax=Streptomyces sp. ICN903 TaxID=2964654 RepID=UPI001EDC8889|nr:hypothetical protein [Streptomyces sp. ICN903]MCG3041141.1 hypothetical protein [Streptomyces sp. ICN903]
MNTSEISASVRELLAAVLEAVDLPYPATIGDSERYREVLEQRVLHASITLQNVLHDRPLMDIAWEAEYLRERLAEHPPTGYRHAGGEGR